MVKRVLMIAYHYPPFQGSSGIHRTLKFSQYLPELGWEPIMLTAHPRAYPSISDHQIGEIPPQATVHRAFALDTSRHLSIKGRYFRFMALPDRWVTWWFGAMISGLRLIHRHRPTVIWSTYPIATAHLIALSLHRLTGIPWVADFRDPMIDDVFPDNPMTRRMFRWIEEKTIAHCTRVVCTTPGAIRAYQARYPSIPASRFTLIENGYDEGNFVQAEATTIRRDRAGRSFTLLHSGVIYPSERDPTELFAALAALLRRGQISAVNFRLLLRATGHDAYLNKLIKHHGIESLVSLAPPSPYRDALAEMLSADGLLLLQASNCNNQIPAKLYEYVRAQRPILALTDPHGDTAGILLNAGIDTIARLDSRDEIMQELLRFLDLATHDQAPVASLKSVQASTRRSRTGELAQLLDGLVREA